MVEKLFCSPETMSRLGRSLASSLPWTSSAGREEWRQKWPFLSTICSQMRPFLWVLLAIPSCCRTILRLRLFTVWPYQIPSPEWLLLGRTKIDRRSKTSFILSSKLMKLLNAAYEMIYIEFLGILYKYFDSVQIIHRHPCNLTPSFSSSHLFCLSYCWRASFLLLLLKTFMIHRRRRIRIFRHVYF